MLQALSEFFQTDGAAVANVFCTVWRFVAPALALLVLWRCAKPLLRFRREPETWAWLVMPDGQQLPVTHWENIIGRSKGSDIIVDFPTVSRSHAVLTRYDDGSWSLTDIGSRGAVTVNDEPIEVCALEYGDRICLGGVEMVLAPTTAEEVEEQNYYRTKPAKIAMPGLTLLFLTIFQLLTAMQFCMTSEAEKVNDSTLGFLALIGLQWLLFFLFKIMRRSSFEVETIGFFLTTMGFAVIASYRPSAISKQLICVAAGIIIYLLIAWTMRDLSRAKKFRYVAAVGGFGMLILTLLLSYVFGWQTNGARSWIYLGSFSLQTSELAKLCFIYVGASTMDRLVTKRNLLSFIAYSAATCVCLALMGDFGTALVFFSAFLVIAFLRSGSFATITLACAATGFAAAAALSIRPHIKRRFSTWGHVWEDVQGAGFDQSRAMMCVAIGGLFGVGANKGIFKLQPIQAPDTDYVFAFVSEEWGLIVSILMVVSIIVLTLFVIRSCAVGRSSFYAIGACAAVTIMMVQTILNVLGTMDLLPLTGVTFPFVSNGGSSMMCSWGLLAFIKAADTRQNASLAVKTAKAEEVEQYE